MPLIIPSRNDETRALQTYVRSELPELDPTPERRSKIGALVKSLASALFDWYVALKDYGDNEPFPQTARGDFLYNGWWRALTHLDPTPASPARGNVALTGTAGTTIPKDTRLSGNGVTYTVDSAVAILTQSVAIDSLTFDPVKAVAIVETIGAHLLASGLMVTIAGAATTAFNGTYTVRVTAENELTYVPVSVPAAPAGGNPTLTATWAVATVTAGTVGLKTNIAGGGTLTVSDGVAGASSAAIATFGGIQGGSDTETADAYRGRILKALGTDFGAFTGDEIEIVARGVPGVTRVFVIRATLFGANGVNEGQVKVAFLRDGDANPFPSAQEVADVKAAIVIHCMTAHTAIDDVIVISPTPLIVPFHFVSLSPDTISMRAAITAQLQQFFTESASFGVPIAALDYQCAIKTAYDGQRRQKLVSFVLDAPAGDIATGPDDMPVLGTVTFR